MKKYITLLLLPLLASCSNDDNISNNTDFRIIEKGSVYHRVSVNDNGKYDNRFYATVKNYSTEDMTGYVRFTIKEYGTFNSESGIVPSEKNMAETFFISLETEKIIDETI